MDTDTKVGLGIAGLFVAFIAVVVGGFTFTGYQDDLTRRFQLCLEAKERIVDIQDAGLTFYKVRTPESCATIIFGRPDPLEAIDEK